MNSAPHHLPASQRPRAFQIAASQIGWRYLDIAVHEIRAGEQIDFSHVASEAALVPIRGDLVVNVGADVFRLSRADVFYDAPHVLYVTPGEPMTITALSDSSFSIGAAPAEGRYPTRLIGPEAMRGEIRGGGAATRQVNHLLAAPLPAERLIVYEVLAPGGGWCGWPPHCHDGYDGSPYLEETYYFRFDRPEGIALHRNYRADEQFDEVFVVGDGDLVLVSKGYHITVSTPGSNMYFLNFLAGDLVDDERARPPSFQQIHTWIQGNWTSTSLPLPTSSIGRASPDSQK